MVLSTAASRPHERKKVKYLFAAILFASTVAGFGAANAADGCGPAFHRNREGICRPNREVIVVERPGFVVGRPAEVIVVPRDRGCPRGFFWRNGRCRPL
jgi:hypothetical protein